MRSWPDRRAAGEDLVIIKRAKTQGFCFGVAITVKKAEEAVAQPRARHDARPRRAQSADGRLARRARVCATRTPSTTSTAATLFVRAHGLPIDRLREGGRAEVSRSIDATCPMVTKIHVQAEKLQGRRLQDRRRRRPEPSRGQGDAQPRPGRVVHRDARRRRRRCRARAASASSCSRPGPAPASREIVRRLSAKYYEVRAVNTICTDTHNRQSEVAQLASDVEVMVVVGGKTSANTKHLAELASDERRAHVPHRGPRRAAAAVVRRRRRSPG